MENWILIVGYDRPHFDTAQKEWVKYNVFLHLAVTAADAIEKFSARRYLAVIASYDLPDMMSLIKVVRETEQIPFVVLSQDDSGTRIAESIIRGADTFIIDPDKLIESLTKNKDINYLEINPTPRGNETRMLDNRRDNQIVFTFR